ncbi:MAG: hypothetical protein EBT08_00540 [Betaproteobacteria bacterium]|nr:hypothetical protein [Betaproteobacteria bacterium]
MMLFFCATPQGKAGQISITQGDCNFGVDLIVRDARLSDVMKRLAETLKFDLHFASGDDPMVTIEARNQAPKLLAGLSRTHSLLISQRSDPNCPGHYRIVKAWVLGNGQANVQTNGQRTSGPATPVLKKEAPQPKEAPQLNHLVPTDRAEELARKARENYEAHVKKHGAPPPTSLE